MKFIVLTPELIQKLAAAAGGTSDLFRGWAAGSMTPERAAFVRKLRVEDDCTWRRVAEICHAEWGADWTPPSNQIMGMALCEYAAYVFEENYMEAPWN